MTALILMATLAGSLQETWEAEVRVVRSGKRVEFRTVLSGRIVVRRGEALFAQLREGSAPPLRIWLLDSRAISVQGRSRLARVADLARADRFHALDLVRTGVGSRFRVLQCREETLPPAVSGPGGKPREAVDVLRKSSPALAIAPSSRGRASNHKILLPKHAELARRVRSIRLEGTFPPARIVVDRPYVLERFEFSGWKKIETPVEPVFEVDLSRFRVEER